MDIYVLVLTCSVVQGALLNAMMQVGFKAAVTQQQRDNVMPDVWPGISTL
jgi:hypothetical protein